MNALPVGQCDGQRCVTYHRHRHGFPSLAVRLRASRERMPPVVSLRAFTSFQSLEYPQTSQTTRFGYGLPAWPALAM